MCCIPDQGASGMPCQSALIRAYLLSLPAVAACCKPKHAWQPTAHVNRLCFDSCGDSSMVQWPDWYGSGAAAQHGCCAACCTHRCPAVDICCACFPCSLQLLSVAKADVWFAHPFVSSLVRGTLLCCAYILQKLKVVYGGIWACCAI